MKVTQYNAISVDGFIDDKNNDSSWVSPEDWQEFARYVKEKRAIIMGKKTYEAGLDMFPYDCELNVVLTHDNELLQKNGSDSKVLFFSGTPSEIVEELKLRGYEECLVIGGSDINTQFLSQNLLDELVVSVHPLVLGSGLGLFGSLSQTVQLKRVSTKEMNGDLVQIVYEVRKG